MPNVLLFDESTASHTPSSVSPCSSLQDVSVSFKNNATAPLVPADDGTVTLTRRADIFLATFSGSMQAVEILCSLSILYLFKDELQMDPAPTMLLTTVVRLPWTVKLCWALLADTTLLCEAQRQTLILWGAALCTFSCIFLGAVPHCGVAFATLALLFFFTGIAICSVIGEALLIETAQCFHETKNCLETSARLSRRVSLFLASRKFAFVLMAYVSGFLLNYMTYQHVFLIAALPCLSLLLGAWLLSPHMSSIPKRTFSTDVLLELKSLFRKPELFYTTLFLCVLMATPSSGAAMLYFLTNKLAFTPELLGRLALCQSGAALAGIFAYSIWFKRYSLRSLLLWSTLLVTPFCFVPLIVVQQKEFVILGLSRRFFYLTDTLIVECIGEIQTVPLFILAAQLCPPGLEASVTASLHTAVQLSCLLGVLCSAGLTKLLGITATHFERLPLLIVLSGVSTFLPLSFIHLIPNTKPAESKINKQIGFQDESMRNVVGHW